MFFLSKLIAQAKEAHGMPDATTVCSNLLIRNNINKTDVLLFSIFKSVYQVQKAMHLEFITKNHGKDIAAEICMVCIR